MFLRCLGPHDIQTSQVCYVKSLSSTHFLLTILPKTFADLKALLVDDAALEGQNLEALTLVETPIPKVIVTPDFTQLMPSCLYFFIYTFPHFISLNFLRHKLARARNLFEYIQRIFNGSVHVNVFVLGKSANKYDAVVLLLFNGKLSVFFIQRQISMR